MCARSHKSSGGVRTPREAVSHCEDQQMKQLDTSHHDRGSQRRSPRVQQMKQLDSPLQHLVSQSWKPELEVMETVDLA